MKKTFFYICSALILGGLSLAGCAHKKERRAKSVESFQEEGISEKGNRSMDKQDDRY